MLIAKAKYSPVSTSQPTRNLSEHSTLPPDRVIHTAHYEIKLEDDDDNDPSYPEGLISKNMSSRAGDAMISKSHMPSVEKRCPSKASGASRTTNRMVTRYTTK
jgi:hypothetical protein